MPGERVHIRVNKTESTMINEIMLSGDFADKSSAVRFCIHFTTVILSKLPAAIGESFIESVESFSIDSK